MSDTIDDAPEPAPRRPAPSRPKRTRRASYPIPDPRFAQRLQVLQHARAAAEKRGDTDGFAKLTADVEALLDGGCSAPT